MGCDGNISILNRIGERTVIGLHVDDMPGKTGELPRFFMVRFLKPSTSLLPLSSLLPHYPQIVVVRTETMHRNPYFSPFIDYLFPAFQWEYTV